MIIIWPRVSKTVGVVMIIIMPVGIWLRVNRLPRVYSLYTVTRGLPRGIYFAALRANPPCIVVIVFCAYMGCSVWDICST